MNINENFEALKQYMVANFNAKIAAGGKEIVKRCHICGDSKDPTSRHMYIGLRDGKIVYNCFKCNAHGIVNGNFFRDLGVYDINIISICSAQNSSYNGEEYKNDTKSHFRAIKNPILTYRDSPETLEKLKYINQRLGINLSINNLSEFKIILNLYDFLNANGINFLTRYKDICDQLDMYFLGFLSMDNKYINMRRLVPENQVSKYINSRYVNYNIYNSENNDGRYYIIPAAINPNYRVIMRIAEGPFDILGIYFNTNISPENTIFASIGGKSYMSIVKYFLMRYGLINVDLHIYVDNDIDNYEITKIKNLISYNHYIKIYMHRNLFPGEKDFGVCKEKIDDKIIQI